MKSKKIYFDYAATTPLDLRVLKAMLPYFREKYGNPSSIHFFGQEAISALDQARKTIAQAVNTDFRGVIFTGSATEANNLVLRGLVKNKKLINLFQNQPPKIIISSIEHDSILETAKDLEKEGIEVVFLPVDQNGFVKKEILEKNIDERTILISIIFANNEIGVVQPIEELSKIIKKFKKPYPFFHTDAVQAFQFFKIDFQKLDIDFATISSHKIYGPKGIGALLISPHLFQVKEWLKPIITGGGQEFGFRSGTENVPSIVGFAKAVSIIEKTREKEFQRIFKLRRYFWTQLKKINPSLETNPKILSEIILKNDQKAPFLPNILNIYFPQSGAEDLLVTLDLLGISISAGSACSARFSKPSHVLQALRFPLSRIKKSFRFSFGRFTSLKEIKKALTLIKKLS